MGKDWGGLAFIRGVIYYKLAPHEQKPFANAFSFGLQNVFRRFSDTALYWVPPFVMAYCLYEWAEHENHMLHRKNPADYESEVDPNAKPEPPKCEKKKKAC